MLPDFSAYFISDIHWPPGPLNTSPSAWAFGSFLAELGELTRRRGSRPLYILGDLFDFWIDRYNIARTLYGPHLEILQQAHQLGVQLHFLPGNRDFSCGPVFKQFTGASISPDRVEIILNEQRIFLHHGDLFCTRDWRYQIYRRWARSRLVAWILRHISEQRLLAMVQWLRQASQTEVNRKKPLVMSIHEKTVQKIFEQGVSYVICGHTHHPQIKTLAGGQLVVLGTWNKEGGWFAGADGPNIRLHPYP